MLRHSFKRDLDAPPIGDSDPGFLGVNDRVAPELLPPGFVCAAQNATFEDGRMQTRRGALTPGFARVDAALLSAGVFLDPQEHLEWLVLAAADALWLCRPGEPPREVPVPALLTGTPGIAQAFDQLFVLQEGGTPYRYDGTVGASAVPVDRSTGTGDGTQPIPLAGAAELLSDRLFVPDGDYVWISDIGDYTRFALGSRQRINTGSADTIVRLFPFTQTTMLVFKGRSIHAIVNAYDDLGTARVEVVNSRLGCLAPRSVATVGADCFFLSPSGVYRVSQVVESRLGTPAEAVSRDIPGLMRRINWRAASGAQGAVVGDYYYLAVPVDGSTWNNAILPYNIRTGAWEGIHTFPNVTNDTQELAVMRIDWLLAFTYRGEERLFAVDFTTGRARLMYEDGACDDAVNTSELLGTPFLINDNYFETESPATWNREPRVGEQVLFNARRYTITARNISPPSRITVTPGGVTGLGNTLWVAGFFPVAMSATLRGHCGAVPGRKQFQTVLLNVETRGASWGASLLVDGNAEEQTLVPATLTPDRTKYKDGSPWTASNAGADHGEPNRQDYAIVLTPTPMQVGTADGDTTDEGVILNRNQADERRFASNQRGRSARIRIASTRGFLALTAAATEGRSIDRNFSPQT